MDVEESILCYWTAVRESHYLVYWVCGRAADGRYGLTNLSGDTYEASLSSAKRHQLLDINESSSENALYGAWRYAFLVLT